MPTYKVRCATCRKEKWPVLPDRPTRYVCALCLAVGPIEGAKRRETGQRGAATRKARQIVPQEPT